MLCCWFTYCCNCAPWWKPCMPEEQMYANQKTGRHSMMYLWFLAKKFNTDIKWELYFYLNYSNLTCFHVTFWKVSQLQYYYHISVQGWACSIILQNSTTIKLKATNIFHYGNVLWMIKLLTLLHILQLRDVAYMFCNWISHITCSADMDFCGSDNVFLVGQMASKPVKAWGL